MVAQVKEKNAGDEVIKTPDNENGAIADKVIRNYSLGSIVPSLIPVPVVDLVAVTAVQLKMLDSLSKTYDVPFKEQAARAAITALVGSTVSLGTSRIVASAMKIIPVFGQLASAATMPVVNGGVTYAIGKVFKKHFETGGTLLSFDTSKMRNYFEEQFEEGKAIVSASK